MSPQNQIDALFARLVFLTIPMLDSGRFKRDFSCFF
ncbi:hypothetical protein AGR4B_Cc61016 [Agrobacterium tumefaciens str. CFBP 5621]|nr:hypothetical protein AGR4B_Cc61016 [Agrobacterium tumefaciens str. CFBP 5621]